MSVRKRWVFGWIVLLLGLALLLTRVVTQNDRGHALLISDIHLNPYINSDVVSRLVAAPYTEWRAILAPFTNEAFFAPAEWGEDATSYNLFSSALDNAVAVMPSPDLILFPGDYPVHDFRMHYTNYTGDATAAGYRSFMYKFFAFVGDEIHRRYPSVPLLTVLGNNDTYLTDYELAPEGAFLADTAELIFANGMSNTCALAEFAPGFRQGGYYSVGIGTSAQVIGFSTAFMSSRYTNEAGFFAYDPALRALRFIEEELDACEAANKPAWLLLHILPGVNGYETAAEWTGPGSLTNALEFWQSDYLETFIQILSDHRDTVRAVFCGHTHMREFRLLSDPATSTVAVPIHVVPGIDATHGNNPAFQTMTYDPATLEVLSITTYALSRSKYEGKTGSAAWDLISSYNEAFDLPNFSALEMERLYATLTSSPAAAKTYSRIYETGSGRTQITASNWPVYSAAIRWLTQTNFLDHLD